MRSRNRLRRFQASKQHIILLTVMVGTSCAGCGRMFDREIERVPSPDHRVDAVFVERNAGTLGGRKDFVYIVPSGSHEYEHLLAEDEVLSGDGFDSFKLTWAANQVLDVAYSKGLVYCFRNFWLSNAVDNRKYVVEVRLRPTDDHSLNGAVVPE